MEIKDFIKTTLKDLSEAIQESKTELGKQIKLTNVPLQVKQAGNYGLIDFDLAVEAKDIGTQGGKAGIKITVVEANIGKLKEHSDSTVSRVKFTVEADF